MLLVTLLCSFGLLAAREAQRHKTVFEKIQKEPEYSSFYDLIRNNPMVRSDLLYQPLTVFIPENQAFDLYEDEPHADLAMYHMSFEVKTLKLLNLTSLPSVKLTFPPLWITKDNDDLYINNAKILKDRSNYAAKNRDSPMGQPQVLHMIDRVLDPMIGSPDYSPTAYDYLTSANNWTLDETKKATKFHQKVHENNLLKLFKKEGRHTFFIPLDSGFNTYSYKMMDKKIIRRHIIPDHVLFTRPSAGYTVTMHELVSSYTLSFEQVDDSFFVKSMPQDVTSLDSEELTFSCEILVPNIPLKNGVVHLISAPLGNFKKALKPFPYLPILDKISNDPDLDITYNMGKDTKFNSNLERTDVSYTYFVSKDSAWTKIANMGLEPSESYKDILARHLVVSQAPYSIQELVTMTQLNNYTDIVLNSELGELRISVLKIDDSYFVKWNRKYIKVVKPDYECSNGLVHVLNGPLANFRKVDPERSNQNDVSLVNYLNMLQRIML